MSKFIFFLLTFSFIYSANPVFAMHVTDENQPPFSSQIAGKDLARVKQSTRSVKLFDKKSRRSDATKIPKSLTQLSKFQKTLDGFYNNKDQQDLPIWGHFISVLEKDPLFILKTKTSTIIVGETEEKTKNRLNRKNFFAWSYYMLGRVALAENHQTKLKEYKEIAINCFVNAYLNGSVNLARYLNNNAELLKSIVAQIPQSQNKIDISANLRLLLENENSTKGFGNPLCKEIEQGFTKTGADKKKKILDTIKSRALAGDVECLLVWAEIDDIAGTEEEVKKEQNALKRLIESFVTTHTAIADSRVVKLYHYGMFKGTYGFDREALAFFELQDIYEKDKLAHPMFPIHTGLGAFEDIFTADPEAEESQAYQKVYNPYAKNLTKNFLKTFETIKNDGVVKYTEEQKIKDAEKKLRKEEKERLVREEKQRLKEAQAEQNRLAEEAHQRAEAQRLAAERLLANFEEQQARLAAEAQLAREVAERAQREAAAAQVAREEQTRLAAEAQAAREAAERAQREAEAQAVREAAERAQRARLEEERAQAVHEVAVRTERIRIEEERLQVAREAAEAQAAHEAAIRAQRARLEEERAQAVHEVAVRTERIRIEEERLQVAREVAAAQLAREAAVRAQRVREVAAAQLAREAAVRAQRARLEEEKAQVARDAAARAQRARLEEERAQVARAAATRAQVAPKAPPRVRQPATQLVSGVTLKQPQIKKGKGRIVRKSVVRKAEPKLQIKRKGRPTVEKKEKRKVIELRKVERRKVSKTKGQTRRQVLQVRKQERMKTRKVKGQARRKDFRARRPIARKSAVKAV